ncbi:iron chelate uptake ABC transporter family permease subunit, partial [Streptococcus pneumoniae]|nr:iron chelate uptake ABC transporter family permease subunit [Streptococcus pneumoniae]
MSKSALAYVVSLILLGGAVVLGVTVGTVPISPAVIWNPSSDEAAANILWNIRMPRVVLAGLVGAALAIAGAA